MTHGGLFSGIGGFDLAAQWMGWENVFHCEIEEYQRKLLCQHFPSSISYGDITRTNFTVHRGSIDVLSGGFPCQDISYAKSWTSKGEHIENGINGKRSGLWKEYARTIDEVKPRKGIVIENVAALTNQGLDIIIQDLSELGYDAEWQIIPASFVGAPHLRKRVWIVAYPISIGRDEESIIFSKISKQTIRHSSQWEPSRTICKAYRKKTLPESFGILDGVPPPVDIVERISSLGNAIVPQIAYEIFKVIETI